MKIRNHQVRYDAYKISFSSELYFLLIEDHELISGQGPPKSTQTSTKASSTNPPTQKPAAYRPPHAKNASAIQAEVHNAETMLSFFLFLIVNIIFQLLSMA